MAEPATLTTAAVAGSVAVGLTGSFLGVDYDVLLAGFLAGIIVVASREDAKPLAAALGIMVGLLAQAVADPAGAGVDRHLLLLDALDAILLVEPG